VDGWSRGMGGLVVGGLGMGGLVEWEGCGAVCLFMGTEMKTIYRL
jgi:hypothetical protein